MTALAALLLTGTISCIGGSGGHYEHRFNYPDRSTSSYETSGSLTCVTPPHSDPPADWTRRQLDADELADRGCTVTGALGVRYFVRGCK